jgi:hypothetical protein
MPRRRGARVQSLGRTPSRRWIEIPKPPPAGTSDEPAEGLNLVMERVAQAGHGFRRLVFWRLRCLLPRRRCYLSHPALTTRDPNHQSPLG